MKRILLILCMLTASVSSQAQQTLWFSDNKTEIINKVHDLYNQYEYYYDYTGYDKKAFMKEFTKVKVVEGVNSFVCMAHKFPGDRSSQVWVLAFDKEKVDLIVFTNEISMGYKHTSDYEWPKFRSWYSDILNGY